MLPKGFDTQQSTQSRYEVCEMSGLGISRTLTEYLFSLSEAAPVLCRGGARYTATIRDCHRAPLDRSFLVPAVFRLGRERTGRGVGRGTRFIAGNERHPGTRPGQRAIKGTLNTFLSDRFLARIWRAAFRLSLQAWVFLAASLTSTVLGRERLVWPTPNTAFSEGKPPHTFIQPTERGTVKSGLFGCVRNDGTRFHEGIDLNAVSRTGKGEAADPIFAVMDGRVVYINRSAGKSSYGRYLVIEHVASEPAVHSLYAHLNEFRAGLKKGMRVKAGDVLGTMGRSAGGYRIPRKRVHLHFEMGLRLTDDFQKWYGGRSFDEPNDHGIWNGQNLLGFDPLGYYRKYKEGEIKQPRQFLIGIPTAFTVRVESNIIPDFIRRYPELLTHPLPSSGVVAWDIDFSSYGLPKRWSPIGSSVARETVGRGRIILRKVNGTALQRQNCRDTISSTSRGHRIDDGVIEVLEIIFGKDSVGR